MTQHQFERWCPRCRIRFRVAPPTERSYTRINMKPAQLGYVRDAARTFDAISAAHGDKWTAEEFVDWLCADVREIG